MVALICKHGITPKSTCVLCRREAERNIYKSPEMQEKIIKWESEHHPPAIEPIKIVKESTILNCPICEKSFESKRPWQKYCSDACRYKAHNYPVKPLTPEQKAQKFQHAAEMRLSNPEIFRKRDERYRDTHYIKNGRTIYKYEEDPTLDYEMTHTEPIRAFIPLPEAYKNDPGAYFKEGIIILKNIQKQVGKQRMRA